MKRKSRYFTILLIGGLFIQPLYAQTDNTENLDDIQALKTIVRNAREYVGAARKEFPVYQCRYQWLEDSLRQYVHQYTQRYPYLEEDFGRRDTFMLETKVDERHPDFHLFLLYTKVKKGFRAYDDNHWQKSEMDNVVGCLQTDSCFFMLIGTPPEAYLQKTNNTYTHTYLIRSAWNFGIDQLPAWCIYLHKEPRRQAMIKYYYYDVLFKHNPRD